MPMDYFLTDHVQKRSWQINNLGTSAAALWGFGWAESKLKSCFMIWLSVDTVAIETRANLHNCLFEASDLGSTVYVHNSFRNHKMNCFQTKRTVTFTNSMKYLLNQRKWTGAWTEDKIKMKNRCLATFSAYIYIFQFDYLTQKCHVGVSHSKRLNRIS